MRKVILAYSGGLDTTCCLRWLQERGFEVICFSAGLGSEFSPSDLRQRALKSGARKIYLKDLKAEFASEYILPVLKAGAVYQNRYVLSTALSRPLIAKYLVKIAEQERAGFVAHGCSAKGNDQLRIEAGVKLLNPRLKIVAPLREWNLISRQDEIAYAQEHNLPLKVSGKKIYSIDKNIWGLSVEGGDLEDLGKEPPLNSFVTVRPPALALSSPKDITLEFRKGVPVKLNGRKRKFVDILKSLNILGARCGIGRTDLVEDRVVGLKSREVYEAPAAWLLLKAREELDSLVLDKKSRRLKNILSNEYAELVYQGFWFSRLRLSLDKFFDSLSEKANGIIKLRLYRGNITVISRKARASLYRKEQATYGERDEFPREYAQGFIKLFSRSYSD